MGFSQSKHFVQRASAEKRRGLVWTHPKRLRPDADASSMSIASSSWEFFKLIRALCMWVAIGLWLISKCQAAPHFISLLLFLVRFCHKSCINRFNLPLATPTCWWAPQLIILFQCQNVAARKVRHQFNPFFYVRISWLRESWGACNMESESWVWSCGLTFFSNCRFSNAPMWRSLTALSALEKV